MNIIDILNKDNLEVISIDSQINLDLKDKTVYLVYNNTSEIEVSISLKQNCTLIQIIKSKANVNLKIDVDGYSNCHIVNLNQNEDSYTLNVNTNIAEGAYIEVDELYITKDVLQLNSNYNLNGKNIDLNITNSIIACNGKKESFVTNVSHNDKLSKSNFTTYAISKESSILNVYTNGIIDQGNSKTELHQKTKGIIFDSSSQISANPILEIDEYDVIASHGASIGAIDDEDLYYLMSRGLTKEDSQKLIINGLIYPFIEKIENSNLKEYAIKLIDNAL